VWINVNVVLYMIGGSQEIKETETRKLFNGMQPPQSTYIL
jgi:hypothetical protein